MKTQSRLSILDHFRKRESCGVRCHPKYSSSNVLGNCSFVGMGNMLVSSAWNPRRLQNMVLVVGPNTPADILYGSQQIESDISDESMEREDDVPEYNSEGNDTRMHMSLEEASSPKEDSSFHEIKRFDDRLSIKSTFKALDENEFPSMTHSGCINTTAWLDTGWRLSRARTDDSFLNAMIYSESYASNSNYHSEYAMLSEECPTQLITSGDDTFVKIWDVGTAMSTSPIPSSCTRCPFAYSTSQSQTVPSIDHVHKTRFKYVNQVPGLVNLMANVPTSHEGNVFRAVPAGTGRAGNIITCAADGTVRLCDLEYQRNSNNSNISSRIIMGDSLGMCFSIEMLGQHTGLVCCENGLQSFDLRLSPQNQPSHILLDDCRSCAVYSSSSEDSSYIFTGSKAEVILYDLRFLSDQNPPVVQRYMPFTFNTSTPVYVSGIDISKDKKELLVTYEHDHIYTFSIFPQCHSSPTAEEIFSYELKNEKEPSYITELATYGGHLNRDTFLKAAKYAGPNDEYICTGSDSGHAFIYDKKTSTVVSLLKADSSTCNGICPHPSLPFFITYGIDSTAKLWRATVPVDDNDDDSISGRRMRYTQRKYNPSSIATNWDEIQKRLSNHRKFAVKETSIDVLPADVVLRHNSILQHGLSNIMPPFLLRSIVSRNCPIQNDLMNLPNVLSYNFYEIILNRTPGFSDDELPVQCKFEEFRRRIQVLSLNHQALELGLTFDISQNCKLNMRPLNTHHSLEGSDLNDVDMYPQSPGNWLLFDARFSSTPIHGGFNFCLEDHREHYEFHYANTRYDVGISTSINTDIEYDSSKAWNLLYEIVKALKDQGNIACKSGRINLAASYYDKALNYCSIAYMKYPVKHLEFVIDHMRTFIKNGGRNVLWSDLFKTFISIQLNLSMVYLKPEIHDLTLATKQANNVLGQLAPFVARPGVVVLGKKVKTLQSNQSEKIFLEAKEFQSKAYFRLATAMAEMKDLELALENYERCLECQKVVDPYAPTDKYILHKVTLVKSQIEKKKQKQRKKFVFSFEDALAGNNEKEKG